MSIQNEIDRITNNVAEAYAAVEEKGGSVPEEQNSDNLAEAIRSIESGEAAAYAVNAPIGAIILWSGPESTIPPGWHVCDGTNGTEDLRGRFPLGASEDHPIGETGGSETVTLTEGQMPNHKHSYHYAGSNGSIYLQRTSNNSGSYDTSYTTSNTGTAGSNQPHPNMPPYLALYYIQKISATPTDYTTREDVEEMVGLPVKPITEAEYSALSDEDKNGETAWLVTDAEGSGGNGDAGSDSDGGEIYSTEEVRIGTWIDGKPLYRRVINEIFSGPSTDQYYMASVEVQDVKTAVSIKAMFVGIKDGAVFSLPDANSTASFYNQTISIRSSTSSASRANITIFFEYTKTTD